MLHIQSTPSECAQIGDRVPARDCVLYCSWYSDSCSRYQWQKDTTHYQFLGPAVIARVMESSGLSVDDDSLIYHCNGLENSIAHDMAGKRHSSRQHWHAHRPTSSCTSMPKFILHSKTISTLNGWRYDQSQRDHRYASVAIQCSIQISQLHTKRRVTRRRYEVNCELRRVSNKETAGSIIGGSVP